MGKLAAIARQARLMRSKGWTPQSIARLYRVSVAEVETVLKLPPTPLEQRASQGMRGRFRQVRARHAQGWSIQSIAQHYGLPESEVIRTLEHRRPRGLSRAMPSVEKQRRSEERARQCAEARARERNRRWLPDPSDPEAWRWKDDAGDTVEVLAPPADLVDQLPAAEIPMTMLEPRALEPWAGPTSPYASPDKPRKITAAVLAAAVKLHQDGRSWPAIARELGCHRMSLYHARKGELAK